MKMTQTASFTKLAKHFSREPDFPRYWRPDNGVTKASDRWNAKRMLQWLNRKGAQAEYDGHKFHIIQDVEHPAVFWAQLSGDERWYANALAMGKRASGERSESRSDGPTAQP